jgi:hypothetical protein
MFKIKRQKRKKFFVIKQAIVYCLAFFILAGALYVPQSPVNQISNLQIPKAHAAAGDITGVRIAGDAAHNGWTAEIDIEGLSTAGTYAFGMGTNNDPTNAKIVFTVTSPGYDTNGNATTIVRTIYGTQWVRKAYPDQTLADESSSGGTLTVKVSLSDFIYSGDTSITATIASGFYTKTSVPNNAVTAIPVTNNSTLAYPKSIGRWAWPSFEKVTTDFLLESVVFNRFARNGKPIAALKYTCTDENSHTVTQTVNDMTVSTRTGDQNEVLVYAATIPVTTFTQGDVVTCNFIAYPWVGNSSALLNSDLVANGGDGIAQPDERLGPYTVLIDKANSYGGAFAVIDATNGQNSTAATWVYSSQSTAESNYASAATNSYTTIGNAVQAIKSYNNANHSRNEPGGGTVLLTGTHNWPGTSVASTQGSQDTWFTVTRLSTVTRANAIVNGISTSGINTQRVKFYDVTLFADSSVEAIRGTSTTTDVNWIDNCIINMSTGSNAPLGAWKISHATRNTITALGGGFVNFSTIRSPYVLVRGNAGPAASGPTGTGGIAATFYTLLGNQNIRGVFQATGNGAGHQISDNAIAAFNTHYALGTASGQGWIINSGNPTTLTHGNAYVQNVVERMDNLTWATQIDTDVAATNNIIMWHNTVGGARMGVGYNDTGSTAFLHTNYSFRGNVLEEYANKDDTFPTANAGRTGAWPVGHHVGGAGNYIHDSGGTEEWRGEFIGLHTISSITSTWAFVDNAANDAGGGGDDTGNGDYHLASSSSALNLVASGFAVLPYDLDGNARHNNGFGAAGAYEWDVIAPTVTAFSIPATASSLTVSIDTFTATDAVGVTGYKVTESSTAPAYDAAGWSGSAPTDYTFSTAGAKTLYAWAKDAVGNVSPSLNDSVTITLPTYTIGGTISGLSGTVVLQNNAGDDLSRSANGSFTFATGLGDGAAYAVTVLTQPAGQTCTVSSGSGTVASANVTNVSVACTSNDLTAPTITDVSSDKANGSYATGEVIDIDVTFSEAVTSTGNVTVTLETGTTDRTCTFSVSNSATGTCNYTVQVGDTTSDLTVNTISGSIADQSSNAMSNFVPATNLAANKALIIDTTAPTAAITYSDDDATVKPGDSLTITATFNEALLDSPVVKISISGSNTVSATNMTKTSSTVYAYSHTVGAGDGVSTVALSVGTDVAGNVITSVPTSGATFAVDNTAPVRSAGLPSGSQSAGTTEVTLSLTTDETATCKYGTIAGTAYASIASAFATTGGTSHSDTVTGLSDGQSYDYYIRCTDGSSANSDDYAISFSVASPSSGGGGGGSRGPVPPTPPPTPSSTANTSLAFADVRLVFEGPTYYVIKDNKRYGVTNPEILHSYGLEFKDGRPETPEENLLPFLETLKFGDGSLIKKPNDTTIYLIFDNQKHGFTSEQVFKSLGYSFANVLEVTANELDSLPLGSVLDNHNIAHPTGTHINLDGTIYRISQGTRYSIPNMEVYNSFNIDNSFRYVVPANAYDRLLSEGGVMTIRRINS